MASVRVGVCACVWVLSSTWMCCSSCYLRGERPCFSISGQQQKLIKYMCLDTGNVREQDHESPGIRQLKWCSPNKHKAFCLLNRQLNDTLVAGPQNAFYAKHTVAEIVGFLMQQQWIPLPLHRAVALPSLVNWNFLVLARSTSSVQHGFRGAAHDGSNVGVLQYHIDEKWSRVGWQNSMLK